MTGIYLSEITPPHVGFIGNMISWACCSVVVTLAPVALNQSKNNIDLVFFSLGGITLILFVVNAVFLQETKGKTPKQIRALFLKGVGDKEY